MPSFRCSSTQVGTQHTCKPSNSLVSTAPSSSSSSSSRKTVKPGSTPSREQIRADCHELNSVSTVSGSSVSTISEATSVDSSGTSKPLEIESCSQFPTDMQTDPPAQTNSVAYTSTNQSPAASIPWPMWTVSHMMTLSTPAKVINHYRALKLADHLNDKVSKMMVSGSKTGYREGSGSFADLRSFLDEQLCKEKAGLSEVTISRRLRTRVLLIVGENPEICSICMVEFKDHDLVASLYYCLHEYHENCIKEWLRKCNLCPMCRALAIIPENYASWEADVKLHQAYFLQLHYAIS